MAPVTASTCRALWTALDKYRGDFSRWESSRLFLSFVCASSSLTIGGAWIVLAVAFVNSLPTDRPAKLRSYTVRFETHSILAIQANELLVKMIMKSYVFNEIPCSNNLLWTSEIRTWLHYEQSISWHILFCFYFLSTSRLELLSNNLNCASTILHYTPN